MSPTVKYEGFYYKGVEYLPLGVVEDPKAWNDWLISQGFVSLAQWRLYILEQKPVLTTQFDFVPTHDPRYRNRIKLDLRELDYKFLKSVKVTYK